MESNSGTLLLITFSSMLLLICPQQALGDITLNIPKLPFNIPLNPFVPSSPSPEGSPSPSPSPSSSVDPFSTVVFNPGAVDPVVKKICDVTENPGLCSNSIVPFMHGRADPVAALKTEVHAALNLTTRAVSVMKGMLDDASTSSMMSECVEVCVENYGYAVSDLKQALKALEEDDMGSLKSVLSGVITDIGTCDDTFAETQGLELPLQEEVVETMHKLANNCMDISSLLN